MKKIVLLSKNKHLSAKIKLTGSKSESNRALILQALYPNKINLKNVSNSDDTERLMNALGSEEYKKDIHHAGTAMRFLTAFYALQDNCEVYLFGSERMHQRPIGVLVEALKTIGAKVSYEKEVGYPPLKIHGSALEGGQIELPANISSQYISALMLIAPKLKKGLEIVLKGKITSRPYLEMTAQLMRNFGFKVEFTESEIKIPYHKELAVVHHSVESDWSSASYHYALASIADECEITLSTLKENSLQGDSHLQYIYQEHLGVKTSFKDDKLVLTKDPNAKLKEELKLDLNRTPDIAQTLVVNCFAKGIGCHFTGLETLKIKETDRLEALQAELAKFGAQITIGKDYLILKKGFPKPAKLAIKTYNDHRMAMAFAPLALLFPITIEEPQVVEKSYPDFWKDLQSLAFKTLINVD